MKRWWLAPLLAMAVSPLQAASSIAVANWVEYIDPQILKDFTRETGIEVQYQTYDSEHTAYELAHSASPVDVVVPSTSVFGRMVREKLLKPLELPAGALDDIDQLARLRLMVHDPAHLFGVPYMWGNIGIAINRRQVEAALGKPVPASWGLLFDKGNLEKLQSCGVGLLDAPDNVMAALAYYQGSNLMHASSGEVGRAMKYLGTLWPYYRYVNSGTYLEDMRKNSLCVSMAWEGDALSIREDNPEVKFLVPSEGSDMSMDVLVIPANARNPEGARAFISYLMRPEVAVRNVLFTHFHTASVKASRKLAETGVMEDRRINQFSDQTPRLDIQHKIEQEWNRLQNR